MPLNFKSYRCNKKSAEISIPVAAAAAVVVVV
jgi:hypothetical protein